MGVRNGAPLVGGGEANHGETDKYVHERIGFNYRMNDITGATS